ncbi:hypothetical protein B0H14DRAFT_3869781 [Mycena olivaceomarginata]|nr:hypothetical protein B0H14DRAFT_3869781 [Mycena olivaceomarginata]
MVNRQPQGDRAPRLTADQPRRGRNGRKRIADAKYHSKPEIQEGREFGWLRDVLPEKARRRRWDKPKKPTNALRSTVLLGMAADVPDDDLVFSALSTSQGPDDPTSRAEFDTATNAVVPSLYSGSTPSPLSSVAAVDDKPIRRPKLDEETWLEEGWVLPEYVSPATKTQKRVQRELGLLGPLTPVQVAQFRMLQITHELSDGTDEVPTPVGPFLSSARWESIRSWRSQTEEYEGDWDVEARRSFAETTLFSHGHLF